MAKEKFRCIRYGECEKADNREMLELDASDEPVCPECHGALHPEKDERAGGGGMRGSKKPLMVAVVLALVGLGGFWLMHKSAPPSEANVDTALQEVWPWLK